MQKTIKIKAIIFDVDGLMADTEYYHCKSIAKLMDLYGVKLSNSYLSDFVGVSTKDNFIKLKKDFHIPEKLEKLLLMREEIYLKTIETSKIKAFPGLKEILGYAGKHRIKIAVGSSSLGPQIDFVVPILLKTIGIKTPYRKYFDAVVTGSDVKHKKPAPDIYNLVAKKLGVLPKDCLVLEDSVSGVKAAKAAKMFCIAVKNRYSKNHDLSRADLTVSNLKTALGRIRAAGEK